MCVGFLLRGVCCCFEACFKDFFKALKVSCGITRRQQVKLSYLGLNLLIVGVCLILMSFLPSALGVWQSVIECPKESGGRLSCLGISAIYRISISMSLVYLLILLICFLRNEFSRLFNEQAWCLKFSLVYIVFFSLMYIDNSYIQFYSESAKWLGGCFLIFQLIMMIDIFYKCGEILVAYYDDGYENMKYVLILLSALLYFSTIYFNIQNFNLFPCSSFVNTLNCVLIFIYTVLIVLKVSPNGSLITSGFVSLFQTFFVWSALNNTKEQECILSNQNLYKNLDLVFNIIFILLSLSYVTFFKQNQKSQENSQKINQELSSFRPQVDEEDSEDSDEDYEEEEKEKKKGKYSNKINNSAEIQKKVEEAMRKAQLERKNKRMKDYRDNYYRNFHLIMIISSVYLSMLLTNWGAVDFNSKDWKHFKTSDSSKFIKFLSAWGTSFLYLWTIIAPRLFPDRNFH